MSTDHIPFVFNEVDCKILRKFYSDSIMVRISLVAYARLETCLPSGLRIWVDGGIDGLGKGVPAEASGPYSKHINRFAGFKMIGDPSFQNNPDKKVVRDFVQSVLGTCFKLAHKPDWLSVPQLPMTGNSSRNKINRWLAQYTAEWRAEQHFNGKLILPVLLTHQNQVNLKTQRNSPISLAKNCYELASADGVWVAESSLNDQDGSKTLEKRFQGLIQFHRELNEILPSDTITVAGPYWGMNLVLWARGLVRYPAVGLGNAYRYYIPGGPQHKGKDHIAVLPLRRSVIASQQFQDWIKKALPNIPPLENAHAELTLLYQQYQRVSSNWKSQVAESYKKWFNEISAVPKNGRALALYQQLSSAYVLGKSLPDLPKYEKTARRPERVAQQLMFSCL